MPFIVEVRDNFHYMDESENYTKGKYDNYEEALEVCQNIVDQCMESLDEVGMTKEYLYEQYKMFGDDPFIISEGDCNLVEEAFSAWDYAKTYYDRKHTAALFGLLKSTND